MQFDDWFYSGINVLAGMFLGFAVNGLVQLATSAFWPVAVIIALAFAVIFLLELIFGKLTDGLFLSKITDVRHVNKLERKPLLPIMSLPVGILFGVVLARLGLDDTILALFS